MPKISDKIPAWPLGGFRIGPKTQKSQAGLSGSAWPLRPERGHPIGADTLKAFFDRPLIWLLPFYLSGLLWGRQASPEADKAFFCVALGLAALYLLIWRRAGRLSHSTAPAWKLFLQKGLMALILAASVFFLGGGLAAKSLKAPTHPAHILNRLGIIGAKPIVLGGYVAEGSGGRPGDNYRLMLEAREIIIPGAAGAESVDDVFGLVRLSLGAERVDVEIGDYLRLPVALKPLAGFKNPGGLDYEKYWGAQGVWVGGFVKSPALVTSWPGSAGMLSGLRSRVINFIQAESPGPATGILTAQLAGRRIAVDAKSEETFRALGLSHLLAVSGLHLGLCYGLAFWLIRPLSRRLATIFQTGGQRLQGPGPGSNALAAALALGPVLIYAALAGSASPVLRAALSLFLVILAAVILRRSDPWNIVAAAAWVILLAEPHRLFTASFQLSFVATAAMLAVFLKRPGHDIDEVSSRPAPAWWARPINSELLAYLWGRLKNKGRPGWKESSEALDEKALKAPRGDSFFKKTLLAALAGTIGTAPLVVWHFTWLPLAGIPANLIFTPLLTFFVLIPGLAALCLFPLSPALAAWPMKLAGTVMTALLPVMEKMAEAAGPGLPLPAPGPFFMICFYLAGWIWLRGSAPLKKRLGLAALIVFVGLLPDLALGPGEKGVLRLTVLDVGQGTAVHVNMPDGRQILVDGGGSRNFDPGERVIAPYLSRQGLRRLDVAALTHPDLDHLKGLLSISRHFKPREIWDAPWPQNYSPLYEDFLKSSPHSYRPPLAELYQGRDFGPARLRLIWPPPGRQWPGPKSNESQTNDNSLVFQFAWGKTTFLITGDISQKVENQLAERYGPGLAATVLVAPHHGSRHSLSPEFLKAVNASFIVFSAGRNNFAGLPHPETVRKAQDSGARIWRTDLSGAAVFEARETGDEVAVELINWRD